MKSTSNVLTLKKLLSFAEVNHSRQSLLFKNLLVCLDTLHTSGVYHNCINLDNVWVEDMFYVSLGPFCLPIETNEGQLMFRPPEQVLSEKRPRAELMFKADIWAVGIVFCVLRYGLYFVEQLQSVSSPEDYLRFCSLAFGLDLDQDYSFASSQQLQRLRRGGRTSSQDCDLDVGFLDGVNAELQSLPLLQGVLHPEPQSRFSSKDLLCLNLFRDLLQREPLQPTLETGANKLSRHHASSNGRPAGLRESRDATDRPGNATLVTDDSRGDRPVEARDRDMKGDTVERRREMVREGLREARGDRSEDRGWNKEQPRLGHDEVSIRKSRTYTESSLGRGNEQVDIKWQRNGYGDKLKSEYSEADLQSSPALNKRHYAYTGTAADGRPKSPVQSSSFNQTNTEHPRRQLMYNRRESHQEASLDDKERSVKVSRPFFKSSNSKILEESLTQPKRPPRPEIPLEDDRDEPFNSKLSQTIPSVERRFSKEKLPREPEGTDRSKDLELITYAPKFDLNLRQGTPKNQELRTSREERRRSIENPKLSPKPRAEGSLLSDPRGARREDPMTKKARPLSSNLTAILKLSVIRFMDDSLEAYSFLSGSLVFKRSIMEESNLTMDTDILEAHNEMILDSIFTVSLPSTKLESTEDLRVDLTIYGHKEKSNFKRYLSSGCLDIRSAIVAQLLGPEGQRCVESKWCLLRNTQRVVNAVVQVEVMVEETAPVVTPSQREDSLERTHLHSTMENKRYRQLAVNTLQKEEEIQINDQQAELSRSRIRRRESARTQEEEGLRRSLHSTPKASEPLQLKSQPYERTAQLEGTNPSIKPNFSFGRIAGKPVQDQKEALKREIEDLRNSIDAASNLHEYPRALGLLRDLIKKGANASESTDPN